MRHDFFLCFLFLWMFWLGLGFFCFLVFFETWFLMAAWCGFYLFEEVPGLQCEVHHPGAGILSYGYTIIYLIPCFWTLRWFAVFNAYR